MASEGIIELKNDEIEILLNLSSKITANPYLQTELLVFIINVRNNKRRS